MTRILSLKLELFDNSPNAVVHIELRCGGGWKITEDDKNIFKTKAGGYLRLVNLTELQGVGPGRSGVLQLLDFVCETAKDTYTAEIVEKDNLNTSCQVLVESESNS
jgi:hypothetical protein